MKTALAVLAALLLLTTACGSDSSTDSTDETGGDSNDEFTTLHVGEGEDYATIQAAVDAASAGDLILIGEGTYLESVVVEAPDDIVIRGVDRNKVIVDGEFERENGFKVFSNGVAIENLTVRNFTVNGIFFTGDYDADVTLTGYRASYVTVHNNGVYGLYAFNATKGQFDNSYASGSGDAGYYVGQCNPCDALLYRLTAESNNLGYSGTNSSDVVIAESVWTRNRLGIVPNSQDGEELPPVERNTIVGNLVSDNNNAETPEENDNYRVGTGSGILAVGTVDTVIERNTVVDNERVNIVLIPWLDDVLADGGRR